MIASNSASSSENEVRIRHAVRGCRERISRHASTPLPSARRTSSTDIGIERRHPAHRLVFGARLADDVMSSLGFKQIAKPTAHDLMVVEQEHPDRITHQRPSSRQTSRPAALAARRPGPSPLATKATAMDR